MTRPINALCGEFTATLAGVPHRFNTTLGTIATLEALCGGRSVMEIVGTVVSGRRATDQLALIAAALQAEGVADAATIAAAVDVPEAEAFTLGLMEALGFRLVPRGGEASPAEPGPLAGSTDGDAGASSPSGA